LEALSCRGPSHKTGRDSGLHGPPPLTDLTEGDHPAARALSNARVAKRMTTDTEERTDRDPHAGKILLLGDIKRAFPDVSMVNGSRFEVCAGVDDALDAAARNNFAAIAVVISSIGVHLNVILKELRDCCDAKIILLAQMHEEPAAIQLVHAAYNGAKLVQDYCICPVEPNAFYESVTKPGGRLIPQKPEPAPDKPAEISAPPVPSGVAIKTITRPDEPLAQRIRHLERLATEDDLTGLKNRRYIREFARQIIERAEKENGQVTLLVFDMDNFKHYNDLYGHATGDDILKQAAVLVRHCCRSHDVVGRIGGDEFAVVFWDEPQNKKQRTEDRPQTKDLEPPASERRSSSADHPTEVLAIAKRFAKELEKAELSSLDGLGPEGKGVLTVSGGLATFPREGQTSQELFIQADKALLEAKRSGKNQIYLVGKPQNDIIDIK